MSATLLHGPCVRCRGNPCHAHRSPRAATLRYNVTPEELGAVLRADSRVNAYAIFVAEQNAAEWLAKELPFGHGFVCLDTGKLPTTFKDILAHASNTEQK